MDRIFLGVVLASVAFGAATSSMEAISAAALASAKSAAELAIGLVGYMAMFLGLMKVAEEGGLLLVLARAIRPVMVRLFPDVPPDHPAMGAMIMNIGANMLGLGNAATPLGIKAMQELNRLNTTPGVATNAMVLFLAINTSGLALLPTGVVSMRAKEGSADPWGIVASTLVATACSTVVAVSAAKLYQRLRVFAPPAAEPEAVAAPGEVKENELAAGLLQAAAQEQTAVAVNTLRLVLLGVVLVLAGPPIGAALLDGANPLRQQLLDLSGVIGSWVIPMLFASILLFGASRGVKVYEVFVRGAREGFNTGVMIIPYLVAILGAVGMFRASGGMDLLSRGLSPITGAIGMPAEVLPLALIRPLSGTGASGLMVELLKTHGPDSFIGYMASTLVGSTDTTFYIIAVYFGAVGVTRARHAVAAGVTADLAGALATVAVCHLLFGALAG